MSKRPWKRATDATLADRLGWPRCDRAVALNAAFAFGPYDGPATVVAQSPHQREARSVVVEFMHPVTGRPHQAVVLESEVTYE